ncbi:MAG: dienelactone hydrolase family protein [Anaerolineales bacterium]
MTTANGKMVDFPSNEHTTPGYLAVPEGAGRYPGLVVIQEWWGLVPHIKDVAKRFAGEGFVALAPDLYHGQAASEPDEARKLSMELDRERAVAEILAALAYLQSLDKVAPKKIGVVGFCMGGSLTVATAAASQEVGAAVVFYGMPRDLDIVDTIQAPLLGLYGEQDHGIPVDLVRSFESKLQEVGVDHEVQIYPNAGHAFFNDTRPHIYQPQAAQDAWQRTLDWFTRHLVQR